MENAVRGRSQLNNIMSRLLQTYKECGGEKFNDKLDVETNLNAFDAARVLISSKIELIKEKILSREEKALVGSARAKLNYTIRQAIPYILEDRRKIQRIYESNMKVLGKGLVSFSPEELNLQKQQLQELDEHIAELRDLERGKKDPLASQRKGSVKINGTPTLSMLSGGLNNFQSYSVQQDDTYDILPPIDISDSLERIQRNKETLNDSLQQFSGKLELLHATIEDTSNELDLQKIEKDKIDQKIDNEASYLLGITKRVQEASTEVNGSTKLCIVFVLIVILLLLMTILILYISNLFLPRR